MGWKNCVLLPAVGEQNANYSSNFTQPGKSLLEQPCTGVKFRALPRLMPAQIFIRPLVLLSTLLAAMTAVRGAPYNGWGPSESYGHTGTKVPA